ncbi:MAG: delta-60 repeat domain-containing protein [Acidobacteria bacterium]|nr:delta-60 repeat domain-containing protein [Acidobacteriota bacterium]
MTPSVRSTTRIMAVVCILLGACAVARAQSLDTAFDPGANGNSSAIAVQADGKILVGGYFTMLGGGAGTMTRSPTWPNDPRHSG